jgi:hypothetical protein
MAAPTITVSPSVYRVSVNEITNTVTVASVGPQGERGIPTITSGTLDGGLHSTSTFNQITDLFIDGSAFDGGTP